MRLNLREIDKEFEESIADGQALKGQSTRTEIRIRKSPASRSGYNAAKRDRSGRRVRTKDAQEDSL